MNHTDRNRLAQASERACSVSPTNDNGRADDNVEPASTIFREVLARLHIGVALARRAG